MSPSAGRVLGVDPGSLRAGWAIVEGTADRPRLVAGGEIVLPARLSFPDRLARLHAAVSDLAARYAPDSAAVEAPFHGASARAALQLAHARGVVLAACASAGIAVFEYAPATIKKAVTGSGRAEKLQVQAMVTRLVSGAAGAKGADAMDAIAAAVCHLVASRIPAAVARFR